MMGFLSLRFLIFFTALVVCLWIVKDKRHQHVILLCASYIFYLFGDARFLGLLAGVSVMTWFVGQKLFHSKKRKYLVVGVVLDLLVLGLFKYFNFFIDSFSNVFGMRGFTIKVMLPIGISFYIFQSISYLADILMGKITAQGLLEVLLYIGFFPQIVAGPIVKARDFMPQMEKAHRVTADRLSWGIQKFVTGAFKKAVIADRLGVCVDAVYAAPGAYSGVSLLIAVVSYAIQIYYDFSGYSDMAIGVAHILGFDYKPNFNLPYLAKNPSDFWRRWHISLSTWFRDYVYIPLGGNRKGELRTYLNLLITMLLSGIWHGAGWAFVIWGISHAIASVIHKIYCDKRGVNKNHEYGSFKNALCIVMNFVVVALLWIPFRTNGLSKSLLILKRIFAWNDGVQYLYVFTFIFAIFMLIIECISAKKNGGNDIWKPLDLRRFWPKAAFCTFVLITAVFAYVGDGSFIYAQF